MTECLFKVGKKYKTRGGHVATYMGVNPLGRGSSTHIFCLDNGEIVERWSNGIRCPGEKHVGDVFPEEFKESMEWKGDCVCFEDYGNVTISIPSNFAGKSVHVTLKEIL